MAHRMSFASPRVRSTSIESQEFQEVARRYDVQSVPKVVINDRLAFVGALPEAHFIDALVEGGRSEEGESTSIDEN